MLATVFVTSLIGMALATPSLFFGAGRGEAAGRSAAAATAAVIAAPGLVLLALLGTSTRSLIGAAVLAGAVDLGWLGATRAWNARGHAVWVVATTAGAAYVAYMLSWTLRSHLGVAGTTGGLVLWLMELSAFVLGLMYGWEVVDVLSRRSWPRRCVDGVIGEPAAFPFVSLHVPAHNEPPELVIATLESLLALDYPNFEIVMIDDNTTEVPLWQPVEAFCAGHGIGFHHLEDWPGFKSGALNYALDVTDARAEVIGVIDADYLVEPDYLRRCAPLLNDPAIAFVQTPQDYRDWAQSPYYRRLYYSYKYFFSVSQTSRNERDGAIFGGTMGLISRAALEEVGAWDEWCITEDAELSLRLLRAGYSGQHVERAFGRGIMPLTFEALKRQRFRWCFGGVQILRKHWRSLLPWDRSADNHLSMRQRYDYLAGGLQWFGDLLALAFAALLLFGVTNLAFGSGFTFRRLSGALLVVPPALIALGAFRTTALMRARTGATWRDSAGALGIWLALGFTVAKACARGLVRGEGVFLRTPKTKSDASWRDAVGANRTEVVLGIVLVAGIPAALVSASALTGKLLAALLGWQAMGLLLAPINSLAALHADLPPELRRLRRAEWLRERLTIPVRPLGIGVGALALTGVGVAAALLLAPAAKVSGPLPDVVSEAQGKPRPASPPSSATGSGSDSSGGVTTTTSKKGGLGRSTSSTVSGTVTTVSSAGGGSSTTSSTNAGGSTSSTASSTTSTTRPGATSTTATTAAHATTSQTTPTTRSHP